MLPFGGLQVKHAVQREILGTKTAFAQENHGKTLIELALLFFQVHVILRPTVSRPIRPSVGPADDQILSLYILDKDSVENTISKMCLHMPKKLRDTLNRERVLKNDIQAYMKTSYQRRVNWCVVLPVRETHSHNMVNIYLMIKCLTIQAVT
jgi:hypothetical protein